MCGPWKSSFPCSISFGLLVYFVCQVLGGMLDLYVVGHKMSHSVHFFVLILCLVDGQWAEWGSWGDCSATCGLGTAMRMRNCSNPAPQFGGEECEGSAEDQRSCTERSCPGMI